jgi:hypothetical protein
VKTGNPKKGTALPGAKIPKNWLTGACGGPPGRQNSPVPRSEGDVEVGRIGQELISSSDEP